MTEGPAKNPPRTARVLQSAAAISASCRETLLRQIRCLRDGWLAVALLLGIALGVQGFTWGTYDCLNLDRMALKNVMGKQRPALHGKAARQVPTVQFPPITSFPLSEAIRVMAPELVGGTLPDTVISTLYTHPMIAAEA